MAVYMVKHGVGDTATVMNDTSKGWLQAVVNDMCSYTTSTGTKDGIVLTADYIAKKYGVKTGMALWQAKQVCPDITFVSPRMDLYLRFSRMAHEIYAEYTDRQEPYGIDECWLDVTGSSSLKGDGLLIAQEISRRMKSELGITVKVISLSFTSTEL